MSDAKDANEAEFEDYDPSNETHTAEGGGESDWTLDSSIDEAYEAAEEVEFKNVPPGTYNVVVDNVERKVSQSGNKMLAWTLVITDEGEYKGKKLWKNHVFSSVASLPYIKTDFSICKVVLNPPLSQSILAAIDKLPGIMLKVSVVKQKGDYDGVNVYFKEFLGKMVE